MKKILMVRDSSSGSDELMVLLSSFGYSDIRCLQRETDISGHVEEFDPDLLIMDVHRPDPELLKTVSIMTVNHPCPVIMFVEESDDEFISEVVRSGVSAYVVDGYHHSRVRQIIEIAIARFNETQKLMSELDETKKTLGERKKIDRAKGIIMKQRGCGEEEAYKMMRKMAMDKNMKIANIADRILEVSELLH